MLAITTARGPEVLPMSNRFRTLQQRLDSLVAKDSLRSLKRWPEEWAPSTETPGPGLINFGSNDYLGLASQRLGKNSQQARGAGASPLVCGYTEPHQRLSRMLADWEQTEAAVLLPSGYAACSGALATLPQANDLILSDQLNHASLIDGCRLSAATKMIYPHGQTAIVEDWLIRHRAEFERVWIVTEGVFGMDGKLAPLADLCDLADAYDAIMIVDEAHGTGVLGEDGSGACSHCAVKSRVPIRIGTLSKAIGAQGGFIVGPQVVIDYLINFCRPLIFSTAAPPGVIADAIASVQTIQQEPDRRARVRSLSNRVRQHLGISECSTQESEIPIIPIILGSNEETLGAAAQALAGGLFIPAIRPPTVPTGTSRLRISLSSAHAEIEIDRLLRFLERLPQAMISG
ncbi:MAG: 8-amino-7-oxononanoate synthase [Planctomycetaceae bacterium]|nr:MAG: 8-amino-7-oxononanoate synthase [Planctomycetaceae bacterium]